MIYDMGATSTQKPLNFILYASFTEQALFCVAHWIKENPEQIQHLTN